MASEVMPPLKSNHVQDDAADSSCRCQAIILSTSPMKSSSNTDKNYSCLSYASKVLQNLNSLRQNGRFCDVVIVAGGRVMKAHRAVLSASSPYFQAMFTAGLMEEQKDTIELHSVSPQSLNSLIDFIYTGM